MKGTDLYIYLIERSFIMESTEMTFAEKFSIQPKEDGPSGVWRLDDFLEQIDDVFIPDEESKKFLVIRCED